MTRENKRKTFEKGYYRNHPCYDTFTCRICGRLVVSAGAGSDHRTATTAPNCLTSLHVDEEPGDRSADCGGIMDPIGVWVRGKAGEWAIIHRCRRVRKALFQPGRRRRQSHEADVHCPCGPWPRPPFPLERIEELTDLMGGEGSLPKPVHTP